MIRDELEPGGHRSQDVDESPLERDGESFINEFASRWGINQETAMGILQEIEQSHASDGSESAVGREVMKRELQHRCGIFNTITTYDGNKQFAVWVVIYAHGWAPFMLADKQGNPIKSQQQIADFFGCTKENVRKLAQKIQSDNHLPKVPGQREEEGCEHMAAARNKQLKPA